MFIDFVHRAWAARPGEPALVWNDTTVTTDAMRAAVADANAFLDANAVRAGQVVGLVGDFTPTSIALLLALVERAAIVAPFSRDQKRRDAVKFDIAELEAMIRVDPATDAPAFERLERTASHAYYAELRARGVPGLVLFTSGTSGEPKGAVHDLSKLLVKFDRHRRASLRTLNFLLFDHWGGLNTLFHTIGSGGVVLTCADRSPDTVCALVERHRIELLPASPTFLNLLLLSNAWQRHDLGSLQVITYGTEPMPQSTLDRLKQIFPHVRLKQTYGLIELGVLQSQSRDDGSLWMKIGGAGYDLRVVDGILQIRAESAMLGYLNAPSPFTDDGYFVTGDMVETDGEYFRVLGRKSELINVGGEKVYPQEVENAILQLANVADVTVFGERNPLTGNIVCARVVPREPEDRAAFVARLKRELRGMLQPYKIPMKIQMDDAVSVSDRYKKVRAGIAGTSA